MLDQAVGQSLGRTVLGAIKATRRVVASNTNLGIVLLLTPLAAVPRAKSLRHGIGAILANLTVADSCDVYEAIRLAKPGGLGKVAAEDIAAAPTLPLRQIMELAADRDLVAHQFVNDFQEVLEFGVPRLLEGANRLGSWENAIIYTHLSFLAKYPDSLIAQMWCWGGAASLPHVARGARPGLAGNTSRPVGFPRLRWLALGTGKYA